MNLAAHESVVASVSAIDTRLEAVEKRATTLEGCQRDMASISRTDCLLNEIIPQRARLDDAEDRSRRDNLRFFGFADNPKEIWQESEQKIVSFASEKLGLEIAAENIERAHGIGVYAPDKRPIVKFASYKTKELVQSKRPVLEDTDFYIRDDLSLATQTARKKLLEYGKSLNTSYKLRHNTLTVGGTTYVYNTSDYCVHELKATPSASAPAVSSPRSTRSGRVYGQPSGS